MPLSGLQHVVYCPRQFALIHVEGMWSENLHTARGHNFHQRAHEGRREVRGTEVMEFGVAVRSLSLGVAGVTDGVQFGYVDRTLRELTSVVPIEYKVGRPKRGLWDVVQVAAQGICLEEMLGISVQHAYLYYGATRRRVEVEVDSHVREAVQAAAATMHQLVDAGRTPRPAYSAGRCDACSLFDICRPREIERRDASAYLRSAIDRVMQE